ncbi:hypothetical protein A7A78_06465 [Aequorivita soesokkakensis]|uniref:Uncharacterized protein n=1 Tax=Aequorivita soesokkakensis TaxID=1385699 RepID=A0A1A9LAQ3_9FLAO|nr:hypothetical protein [Aequorivita soesokkakensis]OAD90368.1 hypothetical protein A7A78_06465 [Aequorivita soesokkakensis]
MIKKIHLSLILFETLALFFLINGIQRLYLASQREKFNAIMSDDLDKYYSLTSLKASDFFIVRGYWTFGAFILGILIIGIINWKNKINIINSILTFVIVLLLFPTGVFVKGILNNYLNYFSGLFSENYSISFLIGGSILSLIGLIILWRITHAKENTMHNKELS